MTQQQKAPPADPMFNMTVKLYGLAALLFAHCYDQEAKEMYKKIAPEAEALIKKELEKLKA